MRPGVKGTVTSWPAFFAARSTPAQPASTIRSASETFLPPDADALKPSWMPSRAFSTLASWAGWLTSQSFCGARRIRAPFAPPRLSDPRNVDADAHAVETSSETDRPEARTLPLSEAMSASSISGWSDRGDGVLPDELLGGDLGPEIAGLGPMSRWVSLNHARANASASWSGILEESPRDLLVGGVDSQGDVGGQHGRRDALRRVVGVGDGARAGTVLRLPLVGAGRALRQLPFVAEQVLEVAVAPLRRRGRPGDLQAAGDRVGAGAGAEVVPPAQALRLQARGFRLRPDVATTARRRGSCRRCGRRRSGRRSPRRPSPCGRRCRGCRGPTPTGSGLPSGPSGLT